MTTNGRTAARSKKLGQRQNKEILALGGAALLALALLGAGQAFAAATPQAQQPAAGQVQNGQAAVPPVQPPAPPVPPVQPAAPQVQPPAPQVQPPAPQAQNGQAAAPQAQNGQAAAPQAQNGQAGAAACVPQNPADAKKAAQLGKVDAALTEVAAELQKFGAADAAKAVQKEVAEVQGKVADLTGCQPAAAGAAANGAPANGAPANGAAVQQMAAAMAAPNLTPAQIQQMLAQQVATLQAQA